MVKHQDDCAKLSIGGDCNCAPTPLLYETLRYPCGCEASGTYPLPIYCDQHGFVRKNLDETLNLRRDAARYWWLRNGNAYEPEEQGVRGGKGLDELCDAGLTVDGEADAG
jgi:hypothetical protein